MTQAGSGKTRFYAKPNLMQANTSFVVLDPKGELLRDTGHLLEEKGYVIRVLDLINMEKSHCYNPFVYLQSDGDVQKLVTNLFKATTPKGSQSNDPFWDTAASMLLMALIMDEKFDILKHPNVALTTDGKAEPYRHGEVTEAVAGISLWNSLEGEVTESKVDAGEFEILSEEDLENMYSENGGKKE